MSDLTEPQKMRLVADFLEAHPELPTAAANTGRWLFNKDEIIAAAKVPGAKKLYNDTALRIEILIAEGLTFDYYISREKVCTPTKIEKTWVPPSEGYYQEKTIEWDCHPLLKPTPEGEAIEAIVKEATPETDNIPF